MNRKPGYGAKLRANLEPPLLRPSHEGEGWCGVVWCGAVCPPRRGMLSRFVSDSATASPLDPPPRRTSELIEE